MKVILQNSANGRLISLQLDDLVKGAAKERMTLIKDYILEEDIQKKFENYLASLSPNEIIDLTIIARGLPLPMFDLIDLDDTVHLKAMDYRKHSTPATTDYKFNR